MKTYHTIMMHGNAVLAVINLLFGMWFSNPQFIIFTVINTICAYISYCVLEDQKDDNRSKRNN